MKDPIKPNDTVKKVARTPWNFMAPQYDERTSCYMDAGTHYGIGYRSPVGHEGNPKVRVDTLPFGRPPTQEVDQAPRRLLKPDMHE